MTACPAPAGLSFRRVAKWLKEAHPEMRELHREQVRRIYGRNVIELPADCDKLALATMVSACVRRAFLGRRLP
jgi:hypothetical protein